MTVVTAVEVVACRAAKKAQPGAQLEVVWKVEAEQAGAVSVEEERAVVAMEEVATVAVARAAAARAVKMGGASGPQA